MLRDYRDGRADAFNADLAAYGRTAGAHRAGVRLPKAAFEVFFNRFDPFTICQVFYVLVLPAGLRATGCRAAGR